MVAAELYERQSELNLQIPARVLVAGCGGIGYWVGLLLAMSGVKKVDIADLDIIERHNLNRLPIIEGNIGRPKVEVLKEHIISLRPDTLVMAYRINITPVALDMLKPPVVMDCTDDLKAQQEIDTWCQGHKVRYIKAGYNGGESISVCSEVAKWSTRKNESTRYEVTPSWSVPVVLCAALAVYKCIYAPSAEFCGNISGWQISELLRQRL